MAYTRTRDWATVDYYGTLGVEPGATDDEIARAFRLLAKQLHPDAGVPLEAAERFKEVSVAYDVLSNERTRRDYDAVRAGLLPRSRPATEARPRNEVQAGPGGAEQRGIGWTRRRAWLAFVGGLAVLVLGVGVSLLVIGLQHADQTRRAGRVAATATRISQDGRARVEFSGPHGRMVTADEPQQKNPGRRGTKVRVLYEPAHPTDVIADESYVARNITLWIVALKLLIGGPILAVVGWRALQRQQTSRQASIDPK
ncbi:MAG: molecular chaperone DnaJ [Actinomycetota bacterium]|nr:molecular chaperone DnaJ [Actinomycetota bacterium]